MISIAIICYISNKYSLNCKYIILYYKKREKMIVIINGEVREFSENISIETVLKELSLDGKVMAAAINMEIVKQDNWASHTVKDGDKLELLDFVGGG